MNRVSRIAKHIERERKGAKGKDNDSSVIERLDTIIRLLEDCLFSKPRGQRSAERTSVKSWVSVLRVSAGSIRV